MSSDLFIELPDGGKFLLGKITKLNDDGTAEVSTNLESLQKLFELRPDLKADFLSRFVMVANNLHTAQS